MLADHAIESDDTLEHFLAWGGSIFDFARSRGLTIMQLLAWWKSDQTQAAVRALEELAAARQTTLARLHAPAAIETAAAVAEDPTVKPPERRRAAALVLRHAAHKPARRRGSQSGCNATSEPEPSSASAPDIESNPAAIDRLVAPDPAYQAEDGWAPPQLHDNPAPDELPAGEAPPLPAAA